MALLINSARRLVALQNHSLRLFSCAKMSTEAENGEKKVEWPWRKAKKVAVMISFVGKDYLGMQRNHGFKTIEEDLLLAFKESGVISEEWYDNPSKGYFQRASRTDKGVSAARMVISARMLVDEDREKTISLINSKLPPSIRVQAIRKVTKNFNSKSACDARTYLYFLPTFAFAPIFPTSDVDDDSASLLVTKSFKMSPELRTRINQVLKLFVGSRFYHNYTSGKVPMEPSSQRFITHFEIGEPMDHGGLEFAIIKIRGQSFMLHQIRKMIGMAIAVVRGQASTETIDKSWDTMRIDVPRAPGLGLMLDEVHYERYNRKFANDGIHESLSWEAVEDQVEAFKTDFIFSEMIRGEIEENSMFDWLKCLPMHTFTQRHFENEVLPISPLRKAERLIRKIDDENIEKSEGGGDDDADEEDAKVTL